MISKQEFLLLSPDRFACNCKNLKRAIISLDVSQPFTKRANEKSKSCQSVLRLRLFVPSHCALRCITSHFWVYQCGEDETERFCMLQLCFRRCLLSDMKIFESIILLILYQLKKNCQGSHRFYRPIGMILPIGSDRADLV